MYTGDMTKRPPFASRIREARQNARLTQEQLADRFGISSQAVQQWETGRSKPEHDRIPELATILNVNVLWLAFGIGLREQNETHRLSSVIDFPGVRRVPSVHHIAAARDLPSARVSATEHVIAHFPCSTDAFRVAVWDRSNSPDINIGDSIIFDPHIRPKPEHIVFAAHGDEREPIIGMLHVARGDGTTRWIVRPANPAWPEHEVVPQNVLGVLSEHSSQRLR